MGLTEDHFSGRIYYCTCVASLLCSELYLAACLTSAAQCNQFIQLGGVSTAALIDLQVSL